MQNTHIEQVRRDYTQDELLRFGIESAQQDQRILQLEDERKQASDHFKGEIQAAELARHEMSKRITLGYETIETPCDVMMDQPTKGLKSFICQKTLKVVRTAPMTDADRPGPLFSEPEGENE